MLPPDALPLHARPRTHHVLRITLGASALVVVSVAASWLVLGRATAAPRTAWPVVPVVLPQLTVVAPPPPPPAPAPAPPPAPAPAPLRATAPVLNAACVLDDAPRDSTCDWDDGFPAISRDGTLIAVKVVPDGGGAMMVNPGLWIQLLDVKTSRVVRALTIFTPDEYVAADDPARPALQAKLAPRVAAAQRVLDAAAFRAMVKLGSNRGAPSESATLRLEFGDDDRAMLRVIDAGASRALWQGGFAPAPAPRPVADDDTGDRCHISSTGEIAVAWDPPTRTLHARVSYMTSPCYCENPVIDYVRRAAR